MTSDYEMSLVCHYDFSIPQAFRTDYLGIGYLQL